MRMRQIVVQTCQILFVTPPTIAGLFALASLEIQQAFYYLIEALILLAIIAGGYRFLRKAETSPHTGVFDGTDHWVPGYYLDEINAARHGAFFRGGEIDENSGGPGFYT